MRRRLTAWIVPGIVAVGLGALIAMGYVQHRRYTPVSVGSKAPDFGAPTPDGHSLRLGELRGKVTLVNVWATWCPPCRYELPSLVRLYDRYHGDGLQILGVAEDDAPGYSGPNGTVATFVRKNGVKFPIVLDPTGRIQNMYGVTGLPTTFVLDRRGRIVARVLGGRDWDSGALAQEIQKLVGE